jgi:hypothetical protein
LRGERIDYTVPQALGDVGVLFTILRSKSDFGCDGDGANYFKVMSDIDERVLPIEATGAGFRGGRITGRLAWDAQLLPQRRPGA